MEIEIDWNGSGEAELLEIGEFKDLEKWIKEFNKAWDGKFKYELRPVDKEKGIFVFVEDEDDEDSYECGVIHKIDEKAMALSGAVHEMVLGAFNRYADEFGLELAA